MQDDRTRQLAEIATSLDTEFATHVDTRRHTECRLWLVTEDRSPRGWVPARPTQALVEHHRRLAGVSGPNWPGSSSESVPVDEAAGIAGAGPVLQLLRWFGLNRARRVCLLLDPENAHRAIWDPADPGHWQLARRIGWSAERPSTVGDADSIPPVGDVRALVVAPAFDLDDDGLMRTLRLRAAVRELLVRGRLTDFEAEELTRAGIAGAEPEHKRGLLAGLGRR